MSAISPAPLAASTLSRRIGLRSGSEPILRRALLWTGAVAAGLAAVALSNPAAYAGAEPTLMFLLRGMALIKASIALAVLGLVHWRFGQPLPSRVALGYSAGACSLVAATVLIWTLSFIPLAAVLFHVGLFGLLMLAWREGRSKRRPVRPAHDGTFLPVPVGRVAAAPWAHSQTAYNQREHSPRHPPTHAEMKCARTPTHRPERFIA